MHKGQRPARHSRTVNTRQGKRQVVVNPHIKPMLAKKGPEFAQNPKYVTERKFDGFRAVALKKNGGVGIFSRNQIEYTAKFPDIAEELRSIPGDYLIDGEIVYLDKDGNDQFDMVQKRIQNEDPILIAQYSRELPVNYFVFDVLKRDGKDLTKMPLQERKRLLQSFIGSHEYVKFLPYTEGIKRSDIIMNQQKLGREGVMHKKLDSVYQPGKRSSDWRKHKFSSDKEILIVGYQKGEGKYVGMLGAIYTAAYHKNQMRYTGKIGTGFSDQQRKDLKALFDKTTRPDVPKIITGFNISNPEIQAAVWLSKPVVAEITYFEISKKKHFRHGVFKGLRPDKLATEVRI